MSSSLILMWGMLTSLLEITPMPRKDLGLVWNLTPKAQLSHLLTIAWVWLVGGIKTLFNLNKM